MFKIESTGNIGLATINPSAKLHVFGRSRSSKIRNILNAISNNNKYTV